MKEYKEEEYRVLFGVEKNTFDEMVRIVEIEYDTTMKTFA